MNNSTGLAVLFSILSLGAIQETFRIFSSSDSDIAENRATLIPMAVIITGTFVFLSIKFWLKSSATKNK